APALVAVTAGGRQMPLFRVFSGPPFIRSRQVRPLAPNTPERPPVGARAAPAARARAGVEAGVGGLGLPPPARPTASPPPPRSGTPRAIIERLNRESVKTVTAADIQAKLIAAGVDPEPLSPEQLGAKIREETERWGRVVRATGVTAQ